MVNSGKEENELSNVIDISRSSSKGRLLPPLHGSLDLFET